MKRDVCSGAFLVKKNKFLFGKRSKKKSWAPGLWDIVGGRSKKKEDPYQTLQRETYEETGVKIKQAELMTSVNVVEKRQCMQTT
ncbi:MAG: NUDIX domain-containing protein [Ginsengibacter sp.]